MRAAPFVPHTPEDDQPLQGRTRLVVELGWHPTRRAWVWNYASRPPTGESTGGPLLLREEQVPYGPSDRTKRRRRSRTRALLRRLGDLRNDPVFDGLELGSRAWVSRAERLLRAQAS